MTSTNKEDELFYNQLIAEMFHDYSTQDFTYAMLVEKYHISHGTVHNIFKKHSFVKKKFAFQEGLLNESVKNLSSRHAKMLSRLTTIMEKQVERLQLMQRRDKTRILDSSRMKEVLTAFALISKEHRLDNDKPTDNQVMTIKVDMGPGVPLITENHIINAKPTDIEVDVTTHEDQTIIESSAVKEAIEVIVDNQDEDDIVFGSID